MAPPVKTVAGSPTTTASSTSRSVRRPGPGEHPRALRGARQRSRTEDFVGILLDTRTTAAPRRALRQPPRDPGRLDPDDANGNEDFSPDFFWHPRRITPTGWQAEMRDPVLVAALPEKDPQTWGLVLFRNFPRDVPLPVLQRPRAARLELLHLPLGDRSTGITGLPAGRRTSWSRRTAPDEHEDVPGTDAYDGASDNDSPTRARRPRREVAAERRHGARRDDQPRLLADRVRRRARSRRNKRFALFFPEKRPFFLEGVDLFRRRSRRSTRARSRRRAGARGSRASSRGTAYTALVAEDRGGGTVIIPGPVFSRRRLRTSSRSSRSRACARTSGPPSPGCSRPSREIEGGGYNPVVGPDFQWRPGRRTRSSASSSSALRRIRTGPISTPHGSAEAAPARARSRSGCTRRATGTGRSDTRTSATGSGPTTASCRRSATARARRVWATRFFPTGSSRGSGLSRAPTTTSTARAT